VAAAHRQQIAIPAQRRGMLRVGQALPVEFAVIEGALGLRIGDRGTLALIAKRRETRELLAAAGAYRLT
jgi:hypothetical protein